ncbi:thiamine pyrophosphate-binding protein [Occultella glacieicola]|uniref:Thiamine pyrophosphate-binding protein n=1 Tax=Occultella glacieicola TaxID=2518684 RepID=A0ABY2E0F5_9MICO|nr:thiamine pyrophosphate-binding protein [Occultella glacieicola]TDE90891.1 thiamine pyrophosphate-binding protein [Occultella glacieicola]
MQVQEVVARTLVGLGVTQVFGVIGSGNYAVTRSMIDAGATYVAARHEGGAAAMADAYSRMGGGVSALSVHQGCGLTNAVTGITEAAKSGTPMVILAAETAGSALHSNFRIAQDRLIESVGGRSLRVSAGSAARDAALAHRLAVTERIPVLLNLPLDVQGTEVDGVTADAPTPVGEQSRTAAVGRPGTDPPGPDVPRTGPPETTFAGSPAPDPDAVTALVDAFATARRPVIVAGRGARDAGPALRALGEATGALLATSAVVRGLFRGDAWDLDVSGGFATPLAAELIAGADLIVSFGCALNMWTTRHGTLIGPSARVVQVDVDPMAPGRHRPVDLAVIGDSARTAEHTTARLAGRGHTAVGYRTESVRGRIADEGRWRDVLYDDLSTAERIDPRTLTVGLDEILDADRVVAVDSGNFLGYPSMFLEVADERSLCFSQAFQCVGLGLGSAIGTALAHPGRLPVLGTGDGGILMAASELETVVRLGLPLVVIVYNDGGYGAELHHFGRSGTDHGFVEFGDTDLAAIARGYGFTGVTVRRPEDLAPVIDWLRGPRDTPLLIDAKVADSEPSWWLAEAFRGH